MAKKKGKAPKKEPPSRKPAGASKRTAGYKGSGVIRQAMGSGKKPC